MHWHVEYFRRQLSKSNSNLASPVYGSLFEATFAGLSPQLRDQMGLDADERMRDGLRQCLK